MSDMSFSLTDQAWLIDGTADLISAQEMQVRLLAALENIGPEAAVTVEISCAAPTAPALQILHAVRRSLENRGGFAGFGPHAAALSFH